MLRLGSKPAKSGPLFIRWVHAWLGWSGRT
jgi:hypothetical protein